MHKIAVLPVACAAEARRCVLVPHLSVSGVLDDASLQRSAGNEGGIASLLALLCITTAHQVGVKQESLLNERRLLQQVE